MHTADDPTLPTAPGSVIRAKVKDPTRSDTGRAEHVMELATSGYWYSIEGEEWGADEIASFDLLVTARSNDELAAQVQALADEWKVAGDELIESSEEPGVGGDVAFRRLLLGRRDCLAAERLHALIDGAKDGERLIVEQRDYWKRRANDMCNAFLMSEERTLRDVARAVGSMDMTGIPNPQARVIAWVHARADEIRAERRPYFDGDVIVANVHALSGWLDGCLDGIDQTEVKSLPWLREYQASEQESAE